MTRAVWMAFVVAACGGPDANSPSRPLPTYEGPQAELFDDAIDPTAVGLSLEDTRTPLSDDKLLQRTHVGDAVLRAKVLTITEKKDEREGSNIEYQLGFQVLEKLTGKYAPDGEFVVRLDKTAPSAGIVNSLGARLGGKTFVVFLKQFKDANNEPRYYAHFSADSKDVLAAVQNALALEEFKQ
jgi:hypothetical protein